MKYLSRTVSERICLEQYLQTNDDKTIKNAETSKSLSLQYSHSLLCLNQLRNVGFSFFSTVSWHKVRNKSSAIFPYFRMRLTSFNQEKTHDWVNVPHSWRIENFKTKESVPRKWWRLTFLHYLSSWVSWKLYKPIGTIDNGIAVHLSVPENEVRIWNECIFFIITEFHIEKQFYFNFRRE